MGADMLLAMVQAPHTTDNDRRLIVEEITRATARRLDRINWRAALAEITFEDYSAEALADLRARAEEAVVALLHPGRETTWVRVDGRDYLASGGLSTGDSPTDAYELIDLVDQLGIWADPFTPDELDA